MGRDGIRRRKEPVGGNGQADADEQAGADKGAGRHPDIRIPSSRHQYNSFMQKTDPPLFMNSNVLNSCT